MTNSVEVAVENNIDNNIANNIANVIEDTDRQIDFAPLEAYDIRVERQVSLAPYTTIKIGGPAEYFAAVNTVDQFVALVRWAQSIHLPYFVLGGGSNILISDAGIHGLVIYNRCRAVEQPAPNSDGVSVTVSAESGAALAGLARRTARQGLSGLEWAVSVPGTVGGAVVGNAGAHGSEVKDNLIAAQAVDADGALRTWTQTDLRYGYRSSALKRLRPLQAGFKPAVISAAFRLQPGDGDAIRARADGNLAHRRSTQPVEPSLGSTFMNPPGDYAGRLIQQAGLKGAQIGGVQVSSLHANFLINPGGAGHATAADFMALVRHIQDVVQQACGVSLEPEIQLAGEWQTA